MFEIILRSVLIVNERGCGSNGGIFSWWFAEIVIDFKRVSIDSYVLINGGDDLPKLSVVILVERVLKFDSFFFSKIMEKFPSHTKVDAMEVVVEYVQLILIC